MRKNAVKIFNELKLERKCYDLNFLLLPGGVHGYAGHCH